MENQLLPPPTDTLNQIIRQVISQWTSHNKGVASFFAKYEDQAYDQEVAPGRNRAIYLLGHLIAANDGMLPLFNLGQKLYPELYETFQLSADRAVENMPSIQELKQKWETVIATLSGHFHAMTPEDWMSRHTSISPEDFEREPHRNKLNVLLGRTNHQSYHLGQLNLMRG